MLTKDEIVEKIGKIFKPSHMVAYIQQGKDVFANVFLGSLALDDISGEITGSIGVPMIDGENYLYNIFVTIDVDKDDEAYELYRTALYNCGYPFRSQSVEIDAFSDRLEWHMYGAADAGVFLVDEVTSLLEDMTADAMAAQKYLNEVARNRASKFLRSFNKDDSRKEEMRTRQQIMDAVYKATSQRNWYFDEKNNAVYVGSLMHNISAFAVEIDVEVVLIIPYDPLWDIESRIVLTFMADDIEQLDSWNYVINPMSYAGFDKTVSHEDYSTVVTLEMTEPSKQGDLEESITREVDKLSPTLQAVVKEVKAYLREFLDEFGG